MMKLIKESESDNIKFKYYHGFDLANFDDSDKTTFIICFIKENENYEPFPESNNLVIWQYPNYINDVNVVVETFQRYYENLNLDIMPWQPIAGITNGKFKNVI